MVSETNPVKPTKKFVADFEAVHKYYGCSASECDEMRVEARKNFGESIPCFASLAREIFGPEHGINKRITDNIEAERNQEKQP